MAVKHMPVGSLIIGVDLAPIKPIRGVKTLLGDSGMRHDTNTIIGNRVGEDLYNGVAHNSGADLANGGSLSEMGVMATADADMSAAEREEYVGQVMATVRLAPELL